MSEWPSESFELCKGPQDGAKVRPVGTVMPQEIYVGTKWLGDGFAAWATEWCPRFPCRYVMDGFKFVFRGGDDA